MTILLDRYASSVSAPTESMREMRHRLRNTAGRIMGRMARVAKCGKVRCSQTVDIFRSKSGSRFSGVSTCGSVWACPVCASKISEGRKDEVQAACERHKATGGEIYMATFTVPHSSFQTCDELRAGVTSAWRRVCSGRGWLKMKTLYGISFYIRAMETTHGGNGWHPHLHVLLFISSPLGESVERFLKDQLFERWQDAIEKEGLGICSPDAFDLVKSQDGPEAAYYVAKWGAGSEISKGSSKRANGGNCAPWELLDRADKGHKRSARLFEEYAIAFYGSRQLTWSKGLKDAYDIQEVAEEILAEKEMEQAQIDLPLPDTLPEGRIGIFSVATWDEIVKQKLTASVLDRAYTGGWPAVSDLLKRKGINNEYEQTAERVPQPPIDNARARNERRQGAIEVERQKDTEFVQAIRHAAPRNAFQRAVDAIYPKR